jgi:hypothetical protein
MKNTLLLLPVAAVILCVMALALAGPALTLYGLYTAINGGGYGLLAAGAATWLFMGPKPWHGPRTGAVPKLAVVEAPEAPAGPLKNVAPDFNLEAAVTLGKKISVRPAIRLKGQRHDLGQP